MWSIIAGISLISAVAFVVVMFAYLVVVAGSMSR